MKEDESLIFSADEERNTIELDSTILLDLPCWLFWPMLISIQDNAKINLGIIKTKFALIKNDCPMTSLPKILPSPLPSHLYPLLLLSFVKKCIPTWYSITYLFAYDLAPKLQPELHKSKYFSALCYVLRRTQSFLRRGTKNLQSKRSTHDGFYRKTPLLSLQISYHMIPMDLGRKDHIKHQEADISLHTCYL